MSTFNNDQAGVRSAPPADPDLAEQAVPNHGIPSQDPESAAQVGLLPEEAERESKSALVGGGAMAGMATGAAAGAVVGGPIGVLVGGTVGTIVGALGGEAAGMLTKPETETETELRSSSRDDPLPNAGEDPDGGVLRR